MVNPINTTVTVAGQSVDRSTLTGLQNASEKSGVSFQYLLAKAAQESSLQTDARASTSSATGLFQFTRSTWLDMMKKYGSLYGYGDLASKISVGDDGKATVTDPAAEKRLLALRGNAEASGLMAAEYARDNATSLHDALGRKVDAGDLYLAHFLGAAGAGDLLTAANDKPNTSAAALLPAAAKANQPVFYTPEGRARSAADVVALVRERFTDKLDRYAGLAASMGEDTEEATIAPERAPVRVASAALTNSDAAPPVAQNDPSKAMVSRFVLEELAKMISAKPMTMSDDSDGEENADDTGLSAGGFQGADFAATMAQALAKSHASAPTPGPARSPNHDIMRTYDMLNAVPTAAPFALRKTESN